MKANLRRTVEPDYESLDCLIKVRDKKIPLRSKSGVDK